MRDVIVVGGGISGLTSALECHVAGRPVVLLEAETTIGGVFSTHEKDGFLYELGPHSTLDRDPVIELVKSVGLSDSISYPPQSVKRRYLWSRAKSATPTTPTGTLQKFPLSVFAALRSPILSFTGKLRVLGELVTQSESYEDESVSAFLRRRFGAEVAAVASAVLGGIYAANLDTLSVRAALPRLWGLEREHGSVIRGFVQSRGTSPRSRMPRIITFRGGMQALSRAIANALPPASVRPDSEVRRIHPIAGGWSVQLKNGEGYEAHNLILAVPAKAAAYLLQSINAELSNALRNIPYAPVGVLEVSFQKEHCKNPLEGFGVLTAAARGFPLLGAIANSSLFPERSPAEELFLSCFLGGAVNPELADARSDAIQELALVELRELIGASTRGRVIDAKYWPEAIPNYPVGHFRTQKLLETFEQSNPTVRVIGNWRSGVSIADCIVRASAAARSLPPSVGAG